MSNITSLEINKKKIQIGKDNFPSDRYINFQLPTNEGTYIAPADGWIMLQLHVQGQNQFFNMTCGQLRCCYPIYTFTNGVLPICLSLPINKSEHAQFFYNCTIIEVVACRFVYAKSALAELE